MSAAVLLRDLSRRGVALEAHGSDLVVDGPAEALSDDVLALLKALKPELLRLLSPEDSSQEWDAADWLAYVDERAGIREHDGKLSRAKAEQLAYEDAVSQWLCLHAEPAAEPQGGCVHCGATDHGDNTLLPVLAPGGHAWVHDLCWEEWHVDRRKQAATALLNLGLFRSAELTPISAPEGSISDSSVPRIR